MATEKKGKYGYICVYRNKRIELWSDSGTYAVQQEAAKLLGAKKSYEVTVFLAEKDDDAVVHTPDF